jgi:serine/threonine-protein kinase HipA
MHCKNFSLLYKEGIGYTLSPAYDLLSVVLTGIEDNDELAMPLTGYGIDDTQNIGGIDKTAFIAAMAINGIEEKIANKLIKKLVKNKSKWMELIDNSFLSMELKEAYTSLITGRIDRLLNT